jgi:hypothetical protein
MREEVGRIVVAGDEILLLIDMMDVLHQPTARTSTDAQFVFVMIIGQWDLLHLLEEATAVVMNTILKAEILMSAVTGIEVDPLMVIGMMGDIVREAW